jgi:antitoxin component YwqK of YwqJK toxin-antitoxin module
MNKIIIILLFILSSFAGYGQIKTVFFDNKDKVTADSTKATTYAIYGKLTGESLWAFKKYDLDGYLMMSGAFKDDALTIAQGKFIYYDWINPNDSFTNRDIVDKGKERYVTLSGEFVNGKRQGKWLSFYENGEIKNVFFYDKGVLQGEYKLFDNAGKLIESGQFVNDKKEGEWQLKGGLQVVVFKNDKVVSVVKKTRKQLKEEQQKKSKL